MKNIMVVDDSQDYFFDLHSVSDDDFRQIFPAPGQNVEFHDDLYARPDLDTLRPVFNRLWYQRIPTYAAKGIDGILFYENWDRKPFYPGKIDLDETISQSPDDKRHKDIIVFYRDPAQGIIATVISNENYNIIFPDDHDVEFSEDLEVRISHSKFSSILKDLARGRKRKINVNGINGVLYVGYLEKKHISSIKLTRIFLGIICLKKTCE